MLSPKKRLIRAMRGENEYVQWDKNDPTNVSSHLMMVRGKEAFPSLFPKEKGTESHDPQDWMDIPDREAAYEEATKRGEVVKFATKRRAAKMALGAWKEKDQNPFIGEFRREAKKELRREMKAMRNRKE